MQFHDDRLEISNPGGFPSGIRLDNLLVAPPRPRNPRLADAFKRAGVVEQDRAQQRLSLDELLVLTELLNERKLTTARAAQLLQRGEAEVRALWHAWSSGARSRLEEKGVAAPTTCPPVPTAHSRTPPPMSG